MVVSRQVHFIILITRDQFKKTFTKLISVAIVFASTNIAIIIHHILRDPGADTGDKRKSKRAQKCGAKKSKEWQEEPLGTMSYQTSSKRLPPFWLLIGARKTQVFWHQWEPERRRPFGTGLVRHCPQGLFSPFFTFLHSTYIFPPV